MPRNDLRAFAIFDPSRIKFLTRDHALVRRHANPEKVGTIHIPSTSRFMDRSDYADVIAVGADVTEFKTGDVVMLPDVMETVSKFTHEDFTYSLIKADLVLGVVDE